MSHLEDKLNTDSKIRNAESTTHCGTDVELGSGNSNKCVIFVQMELKVAGPNGCSANYCPAKTWVHDNSFQGAGCQRSSQLAGCSHILLCWEGQMCH